MYRNIAYNVKNGIGMIWLSTWDEDGKRIEIEVPHQSYLWYEPNKHQNVICDKSDESTSIFGKPLIRKTFKNQWDRKKWCQDNQGTQLFEKLVPIREYLMTNYIGLERSDKFVEFPLKTFFFDIEIKVGDEFPKAADANYPINVISIVDSLTDTEHVWVTTDKVDEVIDKKTQREFDEFLKPYLPSIKTVYHLFESEVEMLKDFITFWSSDYPDIVTGWNIDTFDIPYIINRTFKVLDESWAEKLSPLKNIYKTYSKDLLCDIYHLTGISIIDYLFIYKKFNQGSKQSFKLDYIAELELGFGKLSYEEWDNNIKMFMEGDFRSFVKYNMVDSVLVYLLDRKLNYILLTRKVCNIGLCEYEAIYKSMPYILGALCIQAQKLGVRYLTDVNAVAQYGDDSTNSNDVGYEGAFVYPTQVGYYNQGIASFDFNSLYPNIMISTNISPDTKIGKLINYNPNNERHQIKIANSNKIETISTDQLNQLLEHKCTMSANKVLYYKPNVKRGIVPQFLIDLYDTRVATKNQMKVYKKQKSVVEKENNKIKKYIKELEKQLTK